MKFFYLFLFFITAKIALAQNPTDLALANSFVTEQEKKAAFEENKGQVWNTEGETATEVKYHYQQKGIDIFMQPTGLSYQFTKIHYPDGYKTPSGQDLSPEEQETQDHLRAEIRTETYRMDLELVNANPNASIIADGRSENYVQYYNRNALDVHSFKKLTYQGVYPGIDWVIYTTEKGLKYDFIVQPGADPKQIQVQFKHHEDLKINADGSFTLSSPMGSITEQAPISFQGEQTVQTAFKLEDDIISFDLSNYDHTKQLTIDPSLIWASYYGAFSDDYASDCSVDASGNVYIVGMTQSTINIAFGGHQNNYGGGDHDAFLVKFNSAGTPLWASYYGGSDYDQAVSCTIDANGHVYMTGTTKSTNNIASGGHQNIYAGGFYDAFIVKFDDAGTRLWGSYYGGAGYDYGNDCAVDGANNVYLIGTTSSIAWIASGGHQNTYAGGNDDAYIVKFNSAGTRIWGSYIGGSDNNRGHGCTVDGSGNVYLVGYTYDYLGFSITGHQNAHGGYLDAFIIKLNSAGTVLWGSYYGGTGEEYGTDCIVDGANNVYLIGSTNSTTNIASGGYQNSYGGGYSDGFMVKFNSGGTRLWASYYGGADRDDGVSCTLNGANELYLYGITESSSNISIGNYQSNYRGNRDAFLVKFSNAGIPLWASYYGGLDYDAGTSCAMAPNGDIYITGGTFSTTNIASGGYQNSNNGSFETFLAKLSDSNCATTTGIDYQTACNRYTWIDGNTYTSSNDSATFILTNTGGCDSIVTLDLTINAVDASVSIVGNTMVANTSGALYQWLNCDSSYTPVVGEIGQSFTPTSSNNYALSIITQNACVDTSSCVFITTVGLNNLDSNNPINIYPNPTSGKINIDLGTIEMQNTSVKVYSTDGKLMQHQEQIQGAYYSLELPDIKGLYILEVKTNQGLSYYKLIKK